MGLITLITVLVEKTRRDTAKDHNVVKERLDLIKENMEHVRESLRDDVRDIKSDIHELRVEFHDHLFNHHMGDEPVKSKRRPRATEN